MLNISKRDKKTYKLIRQQTMVTDIINRIERLKWKWAGHVVRQKDNRWTKEKQLCIQEMEKENVDDNRTRWIGDIEKVAGITWER